MKQRLGAALPAALAFAVIASEGAAFSTGPPDGMAGDPPMFRNCTMCHSDFEVDSGDGTLTLSGVPPVYDPGQTYTLTIDITQVDQMRWGFEMTSIAVGNDEGGSLVSIDGNTQVSGVIGDGARDYIKHTQVGTQMGASAGTWDVEWTAPVAGSGDVEFFLAGNAANGNGFNTGDWIYTRRVLSEEAIVGVETGPAIAATVLRAFPNPARAGAVTVSFDLDAADEVGLLVLDANGRVVNAVAPRAYAAGPAAIPVPVSSLVPGRYWVRAAGAFGVRTAPLTVLR